MSDMHREIAGRGRTIFGETRNLISNAGERGWRAAAQAPAAGAGAVIRTELDAAGLVCVRVCVWLAAACSLSSSCSAAAAPLLAVRLINQPTS